MATATPLEDRARRRPPTPGGLERIVRGDLDRFDVEMYENLDTGVLESYLDHRNKREPNATSPIPWASVATAGAVGILAAVVAAYVGITVGLLVGGSWYVLYLHGTSRRAGASSISVWAGAAASAGAIAGGAALVIPALHMVAPGSASAFAGTGSAVPATAALVAVVALAGAFAALLVARARQSLIVEHPVPYPGFEGTIRLLDMAHDASPAAGRRTRHTLAIFGTMFGASGLVAFLRDAPVTAGRTIMDTVFGGATAPGAGLSAAPGATGLTWLNFAVSPLLAGAGWLLRPRLALGLAAGAATTWLIIVPLAVFANVPVPDAVLGETGVRTLGRLGTLGPAAVIAHARIAAVIMTGALIGAGAVALARTIPHIVKTGDGAAVPRRAEPAVRGRYAWPPGAAFVALGALLIGTPVVLAMQGTPLAPALALTFGLGGALPVLAVVGWRALGDTRIEPLSATALIAFALLFLATQGAGASGPESVTLALFGTAAFAGALALGTTVVLNLKGGLYAGSRPYTTVGATLATLIPGALAGVLVATLLGRALATDPLLFAAPHATAFAILADIVTAATASVPLLLIGVAGGMLVELVAGAGIAFALGGFLLLGQGIMIALGALARILWERKEPAKAARENLDAEKRAIRRLDASLAAYGLIAGEAIVAVAILALTR